MTDAGVPLHLVAAEANRQDGALLGSTLAGLAKLGPLPPGVTVHLDRGYAGAPTRTLLAGLGFAAEIAPKGTSSRPARGGWSSVPTTG